MVMLHHRLFDRPRLQLAVAYGSVMGVILLACGCIAHLVMQQAYTRTVDREIEVIAGAFDEKLKKVLEAPGKLKVNADKLLPGICFVNQQCLPMPANLRLFQLLEQGYYLRILDNSGNAIASIGDRPNRFPIYLNHSYDTKDSQGKLYHLHLMPLKMKSGDSWGYLQIGMSVQRLDDYMKSLHLLLLVGVPLTMLSIGGASWWLAGLAMRPIQKSYEQIQQFTADAAHELRTPIAATRTIVETALIDTAFATETQQQILQALHRQVKRLGDLTQDLLLLSRLENPAADLKKESICLNDLIQDVEEELLPMALASQVTFGINIPTGISLSIQGNESQMYRLLINLASNGVKYTPIGGKVIIQLQQDGNQAIITIQDTGIGIAASDLPHIFNRFYRVDHNRSRQSGGSGLGLAIALEIVRSHRGKLKVESNLGEGSSFTVILPL